MSTKTTIKRSYSRFYALAKQLPHFSKEEFLARHTGGRTDSLREMTTSEYQAMLAEMEGIVASAATPVEQNLDKWRKRTMASIGGWLTAVGLDSNGSKIKAIACKAAGLKATESTPAGVLFNAIPLSALRSIYYEFRSKQKVAANTQNLNGIIKIGKN